LYTCGYERAVDLPQTQSGRFSAILAPVMDVARRSRRQTIQRDGHAGPWLGRVPSAHRLRPSIGVRCPASACGAANEFSPFTTNVDL
jgi:hypothetical protein